MTLTIQEIERGRIICVTKMIPPQEVVLSGVYTTSHSWVGPADSYIFEDAIKDGHFTNDDFYHLLGSIGYATSASQEG